MSQTWRRRNRATAGLRVALALVLALLALGAPASALAGVTPTQDQYCPEFDDPDCPQREKPPAEPGDSEKLGALPFTGTDAVALLAVAAALAFTGAALHRLTATADGPDTDSSDEK